jgi:DNA replication protein DnaC
MLSDDQILAELARDLADRRESMDPPPSKAIVSKIPAAMAPDREAELAARKEAGRVAERANRIAGFLSELQRIRGDRYRDCRLSNFEERDARQAPALARLRDYASNIEKHAANGLGVLLFGPCGTGKDHLAMAIAVAFVRTTAKRVAWTSGALLFEALRDSFDGRKTEGEVLSPFARAPMLWVSDPLPALGELKEYKAEALYRLFDGRYSAKLPTIVTANMEPGKADVELTPAIARRLRESTLGIHCNWPPFKPSPL